MPIKANLVNNGHPKQLANKWAWEHPDETCFIVVGKNEGHPFYENDCVLGGGVFFAIKNGESFATSAIEAYPEDFVKET